MEQDIIGFIDDEYTEYNKWFNDNYNKLDIKSLNLFDIFHSDLLYIKFDEFKEKIRDIIKNNENIEDIFNYFDIDIVHFFVPDIVYLKNTVLEKMNLSEDKLIQIYNIIKVR